VVNATPWPNTPGKETQYLVYRRLGGPQGQSEQVQKTLPSPGFDVQTVQPVAARYIDYAILANTLKCMIHSNYYMQKQGKILVQMFLKQIQINM
jgi:hypothetical protein